MTLEQIVATLTLVGSLSVKLIGFPSQIQKVQQTGSIKGISVLYFSLSFVTYTLWTVHGILKKDMTVVIGQGLGILASGILLFVLYRAAKRKAAAGVHDKS
jgi:uncharacterized protein with PQ loop repeat